ncbi:MAG: peptide antibiotic transporter SbmA [Rhizobiaceae bacterium]|nr:peptide antibiotic transporter SbmA [Rhizobiaceae bacterium]
MFKSFFPQPKLFFPSTILWAVFCGALWFGLLGTWKPALDFFSTFASSTPGPDGRPPFLTPDRLYIYSFLILSGIGFSLIWTLYSEHPWRRWSVWGSTLIVLSSYFNVQIDVYLNEWFGSFFDMLQAALTKARVVTVEEYYRSLFSVTGILVVNIIFLVLLSFFISHYVFRWRTAMNNYYVDHWRKVRKIEGASQRVQDDTMRFARGLQSLGVSFISSIMTLIAFLPLLWTLSKQVKNIPFVGDIDGSLVFVALISASFGTILLAIVGIRLPGLEFRNQRVEAAYRKELVYGEDHDDRAEPMTLIELFEGVRKNYFRLYFNYMYFNVAKYAYLQGATFVPYFTLGPTVVAGTITFGIFQQITNAFSQVDSSFRFFATSWNDIVEMTSIYKRLRAFEDAIEGEELSPIEKPYIDSSTTEIAQSEL